MFPWKPLRLIRDLEVQVDYTFSKLIHEPWGCGKNLGNWYPDIDLFEFEDEYVIEVDLPGVLPEDFHFAIGENCLTIRGTRKCTNLVRSARGIVVERGYGSFSRRFPLDETVDETKISVDHQEGVYSIRIPKQR